MTKLQAIRAFCSFVCEDKIVIARDRFYGTNYGMNPLGEHPRLKLPQDLNAPYDDADRRFRRNFVERCPIAQGFSNITLTLLHECGHWATRSILNVVEYEKMVQKAYTQEMYMDIPWEHLATDWAICWLNDPINRKIAKGFERAYFGHE